MLSRSYAIIGTGALGGFYGTRLQKADHPVHFLLRSDYDHVAAHGLRVESPLGDFELPVVNAHRTVETLPSCDVVVVALKTTQNHLLSKLLPPVLHSNSMVLFLQNGLDIEADVAKFLPNTPLLGGLCFLCANKTQPGLIQHLDYGMVQLAQYQPDLKPAGITERMQAIAQDFNQAGIETSFEEDLVLARWKKLIWNIPFNGLSVVLDAQTNELMANPETLTLVEDLMAEIVAVAAAYDRTISTEFLAYMLNLTAQMFPYRTSMKLDFDSRRPMEVETMFGNPVRAAHQMGCESPRMTMLYQQLQFLNGRMKDKPCLS